MVSSPGVLVLGHALRSHVTASELLGLCGAVKGRSLCAWIWRSGARHTSVYDGTTTTSHPVTEIHNLSIMGHVSGPILTDRGMELSRDMAQYHPWGMQVSVGPCELGTSWKVECCSDARSGAK